MYWVGASYSFPDKAIGELLTWLGESKIFFVDLGAPHFVPDMDDRALTVLKQTCSQRGIVPYMVSINAESFYSTPDSGRFSRERIKRSLSQILKTGSRQIGLVANTFPKGMDREQAGTLFLEQLPAAAEIADDMGMVIYVEIHVNGPLYSLEQALALKSKAPERSIGFTLDTSLLHWMGIDFSLACKQLQQFPLNVHIRDITDNDFFGIPGRGRIDFSRCMQALKKINYSGGLVIELFKTRENYALSMAAAVREAMAYLEAVKDAIP